MQPRKLSLGMMGLCVIVGGAVASNLGPKATDRSGMLGQATATLLFVVVGAVMIIVHFVRSKR